MRIYLDSCILIYYIERHQDFFQHIDAQLHDDQTTWMVSDLCRLECMAHPMRSGNDALLNRYRAFFAASDLTTLSCTREVFDRATELRAQHGLKTPDALHLAAAISGSCEVFWTNDHRLDTAANRYLRTLTLH